MADIHDRIYKFVRPAIERKNTTIVSPSDIFFRQFYDGKFCHYDIVVKYMVLRNEFDGVYPEAWNIYKKMQLWGNSEQYAELRVNNFKRTICSLKESGFLHKEAISVDKDAYIRDGSHRTAMALFCGVDVVCTLAKNIPYMARQKIDDFDSTDFEKEEVESINIAYNELMEKLNVPINILIFGIDKARYKKVLSKIMEYGNVVYDGYGKIDDEKYNAISEYKITDIEGKRLNKKKLLKKPYYAVIKVKLYNPKITAMNNREIKILKNVFCYKTLVISEYERLKNAVQSVISGNDVHIVIPTNFLENRYLKKYI